MAASFQLRVLCCVIGSALLVSRIEAQCGGGPDAQAEAENFIQRCGEAGTQAGGIAFISGCAKIKNACPLFDTAPLIKPGPSGAAAIASKSRFRDPFNPIVLFAQVVTDTCVSLFKSNCEAAAAAAAAGRDSKCLELLSTGPRPSAPGCQNVGEGRAIFTTAIREVCDQIPPAIDPCRCTSDGFSNCIDTKIKGCRQHFLNFGDTDRFCYVVNTASCTEATNESVTFPGAAWKLC